LSFSAAASGPDASRPPVMLATLPAKVTYTGAGRSRALCYGLAASGYHWHLKDTVCSRLF
jgi:hypothetical protein